VAWTDKQIGRKAEWILRTDVTVISDRGKTQIGLISRMDNNGLAHSDFLKYKYAADFYSGADKKLVEKVLTRTCRKRE